MNLPDTTSYFETPAHVVLKSPELQCLQLRDKDGKSLEGHRIRFQLVCVYAPDSKTQLSLLAATWNVGAPSPTPPAVPPRPAVVLPSPPALGRTPGSRGGLRQATRGPRGTWGRGWSRAGTSRAGTPSGPTSSWCLCPSLAMNLRAGRRKGARAGGDEGVMPPPVATGA